MMRAADPASDFPGVLAIVAPHMDDETLGCGTLLAHTGVADRAHIVYVTDGARSPEPPGHAGPPAELPGLREREARQAAAVLGVPESHLHFMGLPDGTLSRDAAGLARTLLAVLGGMRPDIVFVPFRRDHHPDHVAVNRTVLGAAAAGALGARVVEYFVYPRWRLLPGADLRNCVVPDRLFRIEPGALAERKRKAIECHRTQVTRYYDWQHRPILTPELVARVSREPEAFVLSEDDRDRVFRGWARVLVPAVQWVEPVLKRWKDRVLR
jgi:LmbE family N-acetylglucosaminyl deacetylase